MSLFILATLLAGGCGYLLSSLVYSPLLKIMVAIIASVLIYIGLLFIIKKSQYNSIKLLVEIQ